MSIRVNTTELKLQANSLKSEVENSQTDIKNANAHIKDVEKSIKDFDREITQTKNKLQELLAKAKSAVSFGEGYLDGLQGDINRTTQRLESAKTAQRNSTRALNEINNRSSMAPPDSQTTLSAANAQRRLASDRNAVSALTTDLDKIQKRATEARSELRELKNLVIEIQEELAETYRLGSKAQIGINNLSNYATMKQNFEASFDRALKLATNTTAYADNLKDVDDKSAAAFERLYIDSITTISPLVSTIIRTAESQLGVSETTDNYVPGKPYAQFHAAWCGDFVRWVLEDSGIDIDASDRAALQSTYRVARAWGVHGAGGGGYGRPATEFDSQPGDILIDRFNGSVAPGGHVSIVVETNINGNPNLVRTIGGNENDKVQTEIKDLSKDNRYLVTISELNN